MSTAIFAFVPVKIATWLSAMWLLGVGALLGLALLTVLFAVVCLCSLLRPLGAALRKREERLRQAQIGERPPPLVGLRLRLVSLFRGLFSAEGPALVLQTVRDGVLWPLLYVVGFMAVLALAVTFVVEKPWELLTSVTRIPAVGTVEKPPIVIPGDESDSSESLVKIPISFRAEELEWIKFDATQSSGDLSWMGVSDELHPTTGKIDIVGGQVNTWQPGQHIVQPFGKQAEVDAIYVRNLGPADARLKITYHTEILYPQVTVVPQVALGVVAVFLIYLLQHALLPKLSAISLSTAKSYALQPMFFLIVAIGCVACFWFIFIPYNTFGEDVKMLKDSGLTLILVLAIIQAVWAASNSVAEEIEGRTALTVLSKPIGRTQFVLGKFVGIGWMLLLLIAILGLFFLFTVAYKPIYDARESAKEMPAWQECFREMIHVLPGLVLAFLEVLVLTAISVAVSTRLPMLANFLIVLTIYVVGHLTPTIVQSTVGQFEIVRFVGQLLATVLPVLDYFNVQESIATNVPISLEYLAWAVLYCFLCCTVAMLAALALFEDRDLA